jgi:hypothetical protein
MPRGATLVVRAKDWSTSIITVTPSGQEAFTMQPAESRRVELAPDETLEITGTGSQSAAATIKVEDWSNEGLVVNDARLIRPSEAVRFEGSEGILQIRQALPIDYAGIIPVMPTVTGLSQNSAVVGDPDFEMIVSGTDFAPYTVIVWNGGDEPTTFISETEVSTIVKPSTASGAASITVGVRSGSQYSNTRPFLFTEPEEP